MISTKKILIYSLLAIVFVSAKLWYRTADSHDVLWLIVWPNALVEWHYNSTAIYDSFKGFFHPALNIYINKSCAGFHFFLLSVLLMGSLVAEHLSTTKHQILALLGVPLLAFILTLVANSARILGALLLERNIGLDFWWLHEAQGAFVYLFFLVSGYWAAQYSFVSLNRRYA